MLDKRPLSLPSSLATAGRVKLTDSLGDDREAVFLVTRTTALSICQREGYVRVDPSLALWFLDTMDRAGRSALRRLVSREQLSSAPLPALDEQQLSSLVRDHIRAGRLVGVRRDGNADATAPSEGVQKRRLISAIESALRGRLGLGSHRYKLVADVDLARLDSREDFEVVMHDAAVRVLAQLAAQQTGGVLADLLRQASEKLSQDWRPPFTKPDGIVLLRHVPARAGTRIEEQPITPSQMAKMVAAEQNVVLEVVVYDLDGKPLKGIAYEIEAPDGESHEGELGSAAQVKVTSTKKGTAGVSLKWADTAAGS